MQAYLSRFLEQCVALALTKLEVNLSKMKRLEKVTWKNLQTWSLILVSVPWLIMCVLG